MLTDTFIAYALGAAVMVSFLLCLLLSVPSWGRRNMAGYGRSAVRARSPLPKGAGVDRR